MAAPTTTAARVRPATEPTVIAAAHVLRAGGLVAFPTETVYGLGADAGSDRAVARIYEAKKRPRFNPLILHVGNRRQAEAVGEFDRRARWAAAEFWPGPLTLVVPRKPTARLSDVALAGLESVALRCPAHPTALSILTKAGRPIAAPSANRSGGISPTTARHVADELDEAVDLIVDGGACLVGIESTILDLTVEPAALLRPGGVPQFELETVLGPIAPSTDAAGHPKSPGRLARHYAPATPLRLDAGMVQADEALLAFGPHPLVGAKTTLNLSPRGDLVEAAANLFAMLRELDGEAASAIAVMPVPESGLGEAINDRLRRAAASDQSPGSLVGSSSVR